MTTGKIRIPRTEDQAIEVLENKFHSKFQMAVKAGLYFGEEVQSVARTILEHTSVKGALKVCGIDFLDTETSVKFITELFEDSEKLPKMRLFTVCVEMSHRNSPTKMFETQIRGYDVKSVECYVQREIEAGSFMERERLSSSHELTLVSVAERVRK